MIWWICGSNPVKPTCSVLLLSDLRRFHLACDSVTDQKGTLLTDPIVTVSSYSLSFLALLGCLFPVIGWLLCGRSCPLLSLCVCHLNSTGALISVCKFGESDLAAHFCWILCHYFACFIRLRDMPYKVLWTLFPFWPTAAVITSCRMIHWILMLILDSHGWYLSSVGTHVKILTLLTLIEFDLTLILRLWMYKFRSGWGFSTSQEGLECSKLVWHPGGGCLERFGGSLRWDEGCYRGW